MVRFTSDCGTFCQTIKWFTFEGVKKRSLLWVERLEDWNRSSLPQGGVCRADHGYYHQMVRAPPAHWESEGVEGRRLTGGLTGRQTVSSTSDRERNKHGRWPTVQLRRPAPFYLHMHVHCALYSD